MKGGNDMNNLFSLEAAAGGMGGGVMMVVYIVAIVAFFYFFMIRPQKKQEKETAAMRNNLSVGDDITTIGGIIGRVTHIKDDVVTIETGADRNKLRIRKSAVSTVDKKFGEEKAAPKGGYKVKKKEEKVLGDAPALKEDKKSKKANKAEEIKEEK